MNYPDDEKSRLIHGHAASVFEDSCRARYHGATRHWERDIELDLVAEDPKAAKSLVVAEIKWRKLTAAERRNVTHQLQSKWSRCALAAKYPKVRFEVLDATLLAKG